MLSLFGELTRNLLVIVFLNLLLEMLLPQGHFHRYIRLVTGLVLILMVLNTMSLILGRMPAPLALLPQLSPGDGRLDENLSGLGRISREQALELYRDSLLRLVLHETEALGGWKLESARFTLEEDPFSEQYGAVRGIDLVIRAQGSAGAGDSDRVYIEPVTPGGAETEKKINREEKPSVQAAEIAQALADRLQISADTVRITVE